jgi:hypothetical protein
MYKVKIPIDRVIEITSNDGGYLGGRCLACNKGGYLREGRSYPHGYKGLGNELVHSKECPMNRWLYKDGRRKY